MGLIIIRVCDVCGEHLTDMCLDEQIAKGVEKIECETKLTCAKCRLKEIRERKRCGELDKKGPGVPIF